MNYTTILNRGEALLLWIYKNITNKFTGAFSLLKDRFPVIEKYPVLKYSLIPVFIASFFALRYILKFVINELAAWTSGFVGETAGYSISERTIVLGIAAVFIVVRVVLKIRSSKQKKDQVEAN